MKYSQDDGRQGVSAWNDPRWRALFFQAVLVLVAGVLVYDLAVNTARNLANRNIASGWDFLTRNSGFDVVFSLIAYSSESNYGRALLVGFLNTLLVSAMGIVLATVLGFAVGVMRLSRNWLAARAASIFVEFLRNTPLLLQLFIWYALVLKPLPDARNAIRIWDIGALSNKGLTLPMPIFGPGAWMALLGLGLAAAGSLIIHRWARKRQAETGERFASGLVALALVIALPVLFFAIAGWPVTFDYPVMGSFSFRGGATLVPEFMALLLALSVYTAAFIAEAVRAGIQAIPRGQSEAAHALGLAPGPIMRLVILPQALRVIIPPLTSQYLNLTKNSSLAVAIGYPDLVAMGGTTLNQTGQAVEIVLVWMTVYLTLSLMTSAFMNWFNRRVRLVER
ncbi:amino acid ABC transporter permease [Aestuariivirga sp.]|jgi:general L-amino acid transport system permease protein|uniref:amino acid ABC transporter permease n=1 Tax=Aestuariivirga sp. TaxID=2650926 RepID=UPI0037845F59